MLTVENVHKFYGPVHVLRGIDLAVDSGSVTCLIGASGSGKSTLLRCLNLLETVDDGVVTFNGTDITDPQVDPDVTRREIGMVFQAFNLFSHLSVLDNVTLGPRRVLKQSTAQAREVASAWLDRVGMADHATTYPDALSGGQQQRVAIARALAMKPKLLLLDEITSALDPVLVGEVLDVVRSVRGSGVAIVMATHEMSFARDIADQVAFMQDGLIAEIGSAQQVLDQPQSASTRAFLDGRGSRHEPG